MGKIDKNWPPSQEHLQAIHDRMIKQGLDPKVKMGETVKKITKAPKATPKKKAGK